MALRAVPDHPKFAHLKSLLKQPKGAVLGWLESVWHFAGRYTPQGNIGKYSDGQIESWMEWDGEPGVLMDAMVKSGWVDVDDLHRLIVHDWHQHADKATRMALKRAKLEFLLPGGTEVVPESEHGVGTVWEHRSQSEEHRGNTVPESGNSVPQSGNGVGTSCTSSSTSTGSGGSAERDDAPPEDDEALLDGQPMLNLARWLLDQCAIPVSFQNQQAVSAAIGAYGREHSLPPHRAAIALAKLARDALRREITVDRWWFEDAKWRKGKSNGNGNAESKLQQAKRRALELGPRKDLYRGDGAGCQS